jgi:hypothetical protein
MNHTMYGISALHDKLLASEEKAYSMELVNGIN